MCGMFKAHKTNIFIVIRITFILANITTFNESLRTLIYFEEAAFKDIFSCFDYYAQRIISPTKSTADSGGADKMGVSIAAWDFKIMAKEYAGSSVEWLTLSFSRRSDLEAFIKLVRLIANLLTVDTIG